MTGELAHITRCLDLVEADIASAIVDRERTQALLAHLAAIAAPRTPASPRCSSSSRAWRRPCAAGSTAIWPSTWSTSAGPRGWSSPPSSGRPARARLCSGDLPGPLRRVHARHRARPAHDRAAPHRAEDAPQDRASGLGGRPTHLPPASAHRDRPREPLPPARGSPAARGAGRRRRPRLAPRDPRGAAVGPAEALPVPGAVRPTRRRATSTPAGTTRARVSRRSTSSRARWRR